MAPVAFGSYASARGLLKVRRPASLVFGWPTSNRTPLASPCDLPNKITTIFARPQFAGGLKHGRKSKE